MRSRLHLALTMIVGAGVGGFVVLPLGMVSGLPKIAALVGAVVGTAIAVGWHFARITGPTIVGAITAALYTALATGYDDYTGGAAIWGFLLGFGVAHAIKWLRQEIRTVPEWAADSEQPQHPISADQLKG